ncbi:unnamed protein product [Alternaria alternata]
MAARHPSDSESIDALLAAAKQLVRQLEEVKSAEAHHERAHSRPGPRSASSKQSICKSDLAAAFKAIVKEAQAQLTKLGELETREVEGHEPEEREAETQERQTHERETHEREAQERETYEQRVSALPRQGHVDQTPTERRLSERRTGDYNLRFPCLLSQLRKNMVVAIEDARHALRCHNVDERGYLILQVQHRWDASELTQLLRGAQASDRDEIKGFALAQGDADCLHAQVAADTSLNLCDMEGFSEACASQQPKEDFEEWIARPPGRVRYLICEPLSDHSINTLLDAGPQCNRRPEIAGVNRPYWYVSCESNTPATLHVEDGNTGSANLLLAGAEKHWIIVHRSSAEKLERCIRDQFPTSRACS